MFVLPAAFWPYIAADDNSETFFLPNWTEKLLFLIFFELDDNNDNVSLSFIDLKFSTEKNNTNAQLIFTTHDISILDQRILDRDQIWFCERDGQQATSLKSLIEFKHRTDILSIEKAYLSGRYGAIPIIDKE